MINAVTGEKLDASPAAARPMSLLAVLSSSRRVDESVVKASIAICGPVISASWRNVGELATIARVIALSIGVLPS